MTATEAVARLDEWGDRASRLRRSAEGSGLLDIREGRLLHDQMRNLEESVRDLRADLAQAAASRQP